MQSRRETHTPGGRVLTSTPVRAALARGHHDVVAHHATGMVAQAGATNRIAATSSRASTPSAAPRLARTSASWWYDRRGVPEPVKWSPHEEPGTQKSWRRPIFPKGCPLSIFGAGELNFRVRDGNGCGLSARVTRIQCVWFAFRQRLCSRSIARAGAGSEIFNFASFGRPRRPGASRSTTLALGQRWKGQALDH